MTSACDACRAAGECCSGACDADAGHPERVIVWIAAALLLAVVAVVVVVALW